VTRSLFTLRAAHENLVTPEIYVLDAQAAAFEQPQTGTVQQRRHQSRRSLHVREHERDLFAREHHGDVDRALRTHQIVQPGKVAIEHLPVQEEERGEGLVLRGRTDPAARSEIAEKSRDVFTSETCGVAPSVELVVSPHPPEIRFLRARR